MKKIKSSKIMGNITGGQRSLFKEITSELKLKRQGVSHAKSNLDMDKSMYKGPGVGISLVHLENSKNSIAVLRRRRSKKGRRRK